MNLLRFLVVLLAFLKMITAREVAVVAANNTLLARPKRQYSPYGQGLFHCSTIYGGGYGGGMACFTYFIVPGPMSWYRANNVCQQMGGTLFSPYTLEDAYYIMNAITPYRTGTQAVNRSFWLGMICQCQFANPFGCYRCIWADGHPVSPQSAPPTSPDDPRIGPLWSNMYYKPDHFARSLNGQMCLLITGHFALYECNFADLQGGAVCQIPYGQGYGGAMTYGQGYGYYPGYGGYGYGGFGKKKK